MGTLERTDSIKEFFDLRSICDLVLDHDYMFHRELCGEVAHTLAGGVSGTVRFPCLISVTAVAAAGGIWRRCFRHGVSRAAKVTIFHRS